MGFNFPTINTESNGIKHQEWPAKEREKNK
jgi:hypothetical protein